MLGALSCWVLPAGSASAQTGGCLVDTARGLAVCPADGGVTTAVWLRQRLGEGYAFAREAPGDAPDAGGGGGPQAGVGYAVTAPDGAALTVWASDLPLLAIAAGDSIADDPKVPARLTLALPDEDAVEVEIGVEWRGFAAQYYEKKNYDLEVRGGDIQIPGLRDDDDWVLNGMPDEPQRIRSFLAQQLWLDLARRPASFSAEAVMGAGTRYVELLLDGDYRGAYLASEQIDRKQLDLARPTDAGARRGELFKAGFWSEATQWEAAPAYDNAAPAYDQWEQKFPDPDDFGNDYAGLHAALTHAAGTGDSAFVAQLTRYFDLDNLVDYFIWINVTTGRDNRGTNTYAARNAADGPWAIIPWDMDATFGSEWNGTYTPNTDWVMGNRVIYRLMESAWPGFREAAAARYFELRESLLTVAELRRRADAARARLAAFATDERESARWPEYVYELTSDPVVNSFAGRLDLMDDYLGRFLVDEVTPPPVDTTDAGAPPVDTTDGGPPPADTTSSLPAGALDLPAMRLSPNPTTGPLVIDLPRAVGVAAVGTIVDGSGRRVRRLDLRAGRNEVDVDELPPGIYTVYMRGWAPARLVRAR